MIKPNFLYNNRYNVQKLISSEVSGVYTETFSGLTYTSGLDSGLTVWTKCRVRELEPIRNLQYDKVTYNDEYIVYCDMDTNLALRDRLLISGRFTLEIIGVDNNNFMSTFNTVNCKIVRY